MYFNTDGQKANDVGIDAHSPFHFSDGRRRAVDVEVGVVRLAVLFDFECEAFDAPVFLFGNFAFALSDNAFEFLHQRFDLGLGHVLACQERMLIKRHTGVPFSLSYTQGEPPNASSLRRKALMSL